MGDQDTSGSIVVSPIGIVMSGDGWDLVPELLGALRTDFGALNVGELRPLAAACVRARHDGGVNSTTSILSNLRPVGSTGLQADHPRTVYRANTEPVGPEAYPSDLAAVIDLRRTDETAAVPHPLATSPGYRRVPMFDPSSGLESAAEAIALEDQYIDWLDRHRTGIADALRAVATADGDVLVCCSAGKDRTGIVSALLARHWGASVSAVADDYSASAAGLADRFARERAVSTDPEATANAQRCVPEIMTTVIEHLEHRWGSVDDYLRAIGLQDAEIAAL